MNPNKDDFVCFSAMDIQFDKFVELGAGGERKTKKGRRRNEKVVRVSHFFFLFLPSFVGMEPFAQFTPTKIEFLSILGQLLTRFSSLFSSLFFLFFPSPPLFPLSSLAKKKSIQEKSTFLCSALHSPLTSFPPGCYLRRDA